MCEMCEPASCQSLRREDVLVARRLCRAVVGRRVGRLRHYFQHFKRGSAAAIPCISSQGGECRWDEGSMGPCPYKDHTRA